MKSTIIIFDDEEAIPARRMKKRELARLLGYDCMRTFQRHVAMQLREAYNKNVHYFTASEVKELSARLG